MYKKHILLYITILSTFLTAFFSNIYAETTTVTESTTEATTEAPSTINNYADASKKLDISARACMLIDANTGVVIYEKNPHEKLYPASITKIMTAFLGCQYGKFDQVLTASHNAIFGIGEGSSIIGIHEGEKITLLSGLYGIMMESANEVCMMVAEQIDGTVDKFVDRMNKQAQDWGCKDTHFNNPHGFHDENHYTTAYDMSLIALNAIKNPEFSKIWGTVEYTIPATNMDVARTLHHKDKMLRPTSSYYYQYAIGGKTGFHDQAKNTLVTCAEKDGTKLITVVMKDEGAEKTYADTVKLMDYGFSLYGNQTLYTADTYKNTVPVKQDYKNIAFDVGEANVVASQNVTAHLPSFVTEDKIKTKVNMDESLKAPIKQGDKVGTLDLLYGDITVGTTDILAADSVASKTTSQLAFMKFIHDFKSIGLKVLKVLAVILAILFIFLIIRGIIRLFTKTKKRKRKKSSKNSKNKKRRKTSSSHKRKRPKTDAEIQAERRARRRRAMEENSRNSSTSSRNRTNRHE